jgi:hypothetical protein
VGVGCAKVARAQGETELAGDLDDVFQAAVRIQAPDSRRQPLIAPGGSEKPHRIASGVDSAWPAHRTRLRRRGTRGRPLMAGTELKLVQARVQATGRRQLGVSPLLDDPPSVENEKLICGQHG